MIGADPCKQPQSKAHRRTATALRNLVHEAAAAFGGFVPSQHMQCTALQHKMRSDAGRAGCPQGT